MIVLSCAFALRTSASTQIDWPPSVSLELVESGLDMPVHVTHAGDGSGRLFVVEQSGQVRILESGNLVPTPFLDIHGRVRAPGDPGAGSEEGLLSIAFPPGFGSGKDYFYVYYTNLDSNNRVSRFHLSADPDIADSGSEELILLLPHPGQQNHNGGQLFFGPDENLYISTGDGGGGDDPDENAENPGVLLGKLLRIDVEPDIPNPVHGPKELLLPIVAGGNSLPYVVPSDNPFINDADYRPEIWALGLRNPWRFSFDRLTGDLYIGDVGQDRREEVDFQEAGIGGQNYGWDIMEGDLCNEPTQGCNTSGLTMPVHVYNNPAEGCSITGGYVYRGPTFPIMKGIYIYADYCQGTIWGLQYNILTSQWENQLLRNTDQTISSFGEDEAGELYLTARGTGRVYKIITP
jgi:glucose/arabinose dehydrogenase